ncbi:MAG: hypothetical protein UV95_C0001G0298 [Candidatus Falkowbacteria bacterium GW2011_GWF2_43_32]|nr:MAG: hypothetical protein UV95_C0001G0298 [Candidatus Falkowbacteria bacterium GW2011_GWF2_43_32]
MKITANTIVATKSFFSNPRLVRYTPPEPPKTPPKPEPRFCIKIESIKSTATAICPILIQKIILFLMKFSNQRRQYFLIVNRQIGQNFPVNLNLVLF